MAGGVGDESHEVAALRSTLRITLRAQGGEEDSAHWQRLHEVVQSLYELVSSGRAAEAVEFAEQVVEVLSGAAAQVVGHPGELRELAQAALDAHSGACLRGDPDPLRLASWLFNLQLEYPDGPEVRLANYVRPLGPSGMASYRHAAEQACRMLPTLRCGQKPRWDRHRWAVVRIMEELADHTGEVAVLVHVLATDLSSSWHYLRICAALQEAGRPEQALAWAERGLAIAESAGAASMLVEVAVDQCLRLGRVERALEFRRSAFRRGPAVDTYLRLHALAEFSGCWPAERAQALDWLREPAADGEPVGRELLDELLRRGL